MRRHIILLLMGMLAAACASARGELGNIGPSNVAGVSHEDLMVATTRTHGNNPALVYGIDRSRKLEFSEAHISIPPNHKVGEIESPSGTPDPSKTFTTEAINGIADQQAFIDRINSKLAARPANKREIFLFVHGYNTTFAEGLFRAAQIRHDFELPSLPIYFSWPSAGQFTLYTYDRDSAVYSRDGLLDLLEMLDKTNTTGITLVGHSMGTFVVVEALRQAKLSKRNKATKNLNLVVLASSDIDIDVFYQQMQPILPLTYPMALLVSDDDKALKFSARLRGGHPRVGSGAEKPAWTDMGITVVDLSSLDDSQGGFEHDKFAASPTFISLIKKRVAYQATLAGDKNRSGTLFSKATNVFGGASDLIVHAPRNILAQ